MLPSTSQTTRKLSREPTATVRKSARLQHYRTPAQDQELSAQVVGDQDRKRRRSRETLSPNRATRKRLRRTPTDETVNDRAGSDCRDHQRADRKRKRDTHDAIDRIAQKRQEASEFTAQKVTGEFVTESEGEESLSRNPIDYWRRHQQWPESFFSAELEEEEAEMNPPSLDILKKKKSASTLRRKASAESLPSPKSSSFVTPSDQQSRELKSAPYRNAGYASLIATRGSYMADFVGKNESGPSQESRDLCRTLLESHQEVPRDTLFADELFENTCRKIIDRNEAKVIQDISLLLVPSAESFATRGSEHLETVIESVNEGWNQSFPLIAPHPQSDYAVGFYFLSFSDAHRERLRPWLCELLEKSIFKATFRMYFPFFARETKCGAEALEIADRQNAHSMTLAVRSVVELFRLVNREKELHRQIIAFSVSHNGDVVRIYGHYPVINGKETRYYRHAIRNFCFTELEGRDKWQCYRFTKNVYDQWVPQHFKRICEAIEQIPPDISFSVDASLPSSESQILSEPMLETTGLMDRNLSGEGTEEGSSSSRSMDTGDRREATCTPNTSVSLKRRKTKEL